jgi:hypothetical protein
MRPRNKNPEVQNSHFGVIRSASRTRTTGGGTIMVIFNEIRHLTKPDFLYFRFLLRSRYKYGTVDSTKQTLSVYNESNDHKQSIAHEEAGGVSHILHEVRCEGRSPPGVCRCRLTYTQFGRLLLKVWHCPTSIDRGHSRG